jgi:hypothetical protein
MEREHPARKTNEAGKALALHFDGRTRSCQAKE